MRLALGSDHAGLPLKEAIKEYLAQYNGVDWDDLGTFSPEAVDYPDIALEVAKAVASGRYDRGILACGTGIGMCITANKVPGVRAALCHDLYSARVTRQDNDSNVLTIGARIVGPALAREIVRVWLETEFAGGRHARRLDKIAAIERMFAGGDCHRGGATKGPGER